MGGLSGDLFFDEPRASSSGATEPQQTETPTPPGDPSRGGTGASPHCPLGPPEERISLCSSGCSTYWLWPWGWGAPSRVVAPGWAIHGPQVRPHLGQRSRDNTLFRVQQSLGSPQPEACPIHSGLGFPNLPPLSEDGLRPGHQDKDQKTTKRRKADAAHQSPIPTSTYFYREHAQGHLCRLGHVAVLHISHSLSSHLFVSTPHRFPLCPLPTSLPLGIWRTPLTGLREMAGHQGFEEFPVRPPLPMGSFS
ncbi:hypothetical protein Cadr_000027034 [Camelus dromedarius]|uniref:Uncharacterized protein n=1 Tax=Camelus dromedarius TaxID=9838 RepID=A0A5N4C5L1_CAMDR|nr:hypothetical protein Cadr_000027034 [Camelus dromedarius]